MRLRALEARVVRLEARRDSSPFAGMTYEEIEAEAQCLLDSLIGETGSFASVVSEMEASDEPELREGARAMVEQFGDRYGYAAPAAA